MAQILDPLPPEQSGKILCCYVNATSKIQVARISNVSNWYFERVVFPGQRLAFEAPIESYLEIHTGMIASAILSDRIPCTRLAISEHSNHGFEADSEPVTDPINKKTIVKTDTIKPLQIAGLISID